MLFTAETEIVLTKCTLLSGGVIESYLVWDEIGSSHSLKNINHYSYQTKYHTSLHKVEITQGDYLDGFFNSERDIKQKDLNAIKDVYEKTIST